MITQAFELGILIETAEWNLSTNLFLSFIFPGPFESEEHWIYILFPCASSIVLTLDPQFSCCEQTLFWNLAESHLLH